MNTQEQKKLSESLLAACKAAGVEEPKYIAQDLSGAVWHYKDEPDTNNYGAIWAAFTEQNKKLDHPPYADDWKESLMEWVDHIADTSKMIDMQDAIADAYRKHVGRCGLQTYAQTYRHGWQDALAWKGGEKP